MTGLRKISVTALLILLSFSLFAQTTKIKGRVIDVDTKEGVPFASVYFKGTTIGVSTDLDGYYTLEAKNLTTNILRADLVSYEPKEKQIKIGTFNEVNFELKFQDNLLRKVVVKPDNRYIKWIMRQVEVNKVFNNPEEREHYDCEIYSKMELDLTNAEEQIKNKLLRRNFGFVFDYMDTSVISGQPYLPIMISESRSHFYHQKDPLNDKELLHASKISGVKDEAQFAQFTGNMHIKTNFYDDFISIFDVKIPSPVSEFNVYYNYFLMDSLNVNGRKTYLIRFHPAKFVSSPAFDGEMRVDAEDFAIAEIHVKLKKGSNVNWIRDLVLDSEYERYGDDGWFYKMDKLYADFSVTMRDSSKMMSFLGNKEVSYMNPRFNTPMPDNLRKSLSKVVTENEGFVLDEAYWEKARPYALTDKEQNIYKMVDSIKNVPLYKNIYTIVATFVNGYYDFDYWGIGPYYKLFSFNNLEGARFQFGGRTNADFSKKIRLTAYVAFGTKDREFKGGAKAEYILSTTPTRKLIAEAKRDVLQLGKGANALTESNIMSSVLSKGNTAKMSLVNEYSVTYQHEFSQNFENSIGLEFQRVFSNKYVPMYKPDSIHVTSVATNQLHYSARLSWGETVTRGTFENFRVRGKYPIITFDVIASAKGLGSNAFSYIRTEAKVDYKLNIPPVGTTHIRLSGGKILGKVPYPLLKLHEGNGTYFFDREAFSCMDFYEFASDTWGTLFLEHNFKGFFLGKIPLMKRLQWRETFSVKVAYGTLSKRNDGRTDILLPNEAGIIDPSGVGAPMLFPKGMGSLRKPYMEMGVGVSNIFRVFRVDFFWRMTHRYKEIYGVKTKADHCFALNFGIEFKF